MLPIAEIPEVERWRRHPATSGRFIKETGIGSCIVKPFGD
jgi:hypothetical protein